MKDSNFWKLRFGKKGQAGVITIVLLILISITAVVIVWNVVRPIISDDSAQISTQVLPINLNIGEIFLFANGATHVDVNRRTGGGEIDSLKFVFTDEGGETYVRDVDSAGLGVLETKTYVFDSLPNFDMNSVSVYPVIGNKIGIETKKNINEELSIPEGMVSWWRFENDGGDSAGNNDCIGGDIVSSSRGNVVSINGIGMNCGNEISLNINDKIGVSFWVKTEGDGTIIEKGDNYKIYLDDGRISFSSNGEDISGNKIINDNEWHHVVVTEDWDGISNLFIYVDGDLDYLAELNGLPIPNSENLVIGSGFNGMIDDIMLYNRALSGKEVSSIYGINS